jgi:hypothetical protein
MAVATQYSFNWQELTELLIKHQGIHEGEWMASVEFTLNAGVMGQNPADSRPGMMTLINGIQLVKALQGTPSHLVVDAAQVNPKA